MVRIFPTNPQKRHGVISQISATVLFEVAIVMCYRDTPVNVQSSIEI